MFIKVMHALMGVPPRMKLALVARMSSYREFIVGFFERGPQPTKNQKAIRRDYQLPISIEAKIRLRAPRPLFFVILLWLLANTPADASLFAQASGQSSTVLVTTINQAGEPVPAVTVELKSGGTLIKSLVTDNQGRATFPDVSPGDYEVVASQEKYQTLSRSGLILVAGASLQVDFTMIPRIELKSSIDVEATPETPIEQGSSPSVEIQHAEIKNLPNRPVTVQEVLPLIPGVVRTAEDEIRISGSSETSSAFVVNSADVTEPATGQFGVSVPVDSVESINVYKTPYLAQYGRFTGGVVAVETRRGGDKWHFEFNDPLPEFRIRSLHLVGIRDASPRITFNGPLIRNRLYLSQGIEYALHKLPIRTLSFPNNETKQESVNSFTQFDAILSPYHTLTGTFHVSPRKTNFVNLEYFNPQPVTPSFSAHDYLTTIIDRYSVGTKLVESLVAVTLYTAHVWPQGPEEMILTPVGNRGNYYSQQNRHATRVEWMESLSLSPISHYGTHNIKFGTDVSRVTTHGEFLASPVNIVDTNNLLLKRIEFVDGKLFNRWDLDLGFYGQDHWTFNPKLAMDWGIRFEIQGITETVRIAPRFGLAWTPFGAESAVVRGGFGLFYDQVPLSVFSFTTYPNQVVTTYGPNGEIIDGPRRYLNVMERGTGGGFPFIFGDNEVGNFAPYSAAWNIEVEQPITPRVIVRANYLQSNSYGMVILAPGVANGKDAIVESGSGEQGYRQLELTTRYIWKPGEQLFFSYVRSRSRGDLNEFNRYLGNFPFPVIRPNFFTNLPGDTLNRFLTWGYIRLPRKFSLAPMLEYRNGFPYAQVNASQDYVGIPNRNQTRFPNFFSLDLRVSKDFQVSKKYSVRFSLRGLNLTNHFNPLGVHANVDDPQFGTFFGFYKRRYLLDFDVNY